MKLKSFLACCITFILSWCVTLSISSSALSQTPPRDVWNHSCYIYKDMNRNGKFDLGDKPYAGLRLEVSRPDGTIAWLDSNIDGFANMDTSLGDESKHVFSSGTYGIRAIYPEGWLPLSSDDRQTMEFIRQDNAGGRLVPKETCRPIGVSPILTVTGKIKTEQGMSVSDYRARAISLDRGRTVSLTIGENGNFFSVFEKGDWQLQIFDKRENMIYARDITVEHGALLLSEIDLIENPLPEIDATYRYVGFDDLIVDSLFEVPSGYGELNWLNWISVHNRFYEGGGYVNNTISSEYVAYNSSGVPSLIWSEKPFDFKGVYIGVAWPRGEEDEVLIRAWRHDEPAYEDRLNLTDNGPVFFDASYENITRLEFSHGNYERIVLDNFQYKF